MQVSVITRRGPSVAPAIYLTAIICRNMYLIVIYNYLRFREGRAMVIIVNILLPDAFTPVWFFDNL